MPLTKRQFVLIGSMIVLSGSFSACQPTPTLAPLSAAGIGVGITADDCPNVEIQVGQQLTWTNQDTQEHIVREKPAEGDSRFDSGTLQPGDSFSITLTQPGTYTYECSEDGDRTGTITVEP